MSTVTTTDLQETIQLLPGYDPYDQAGDCWFDEEAARYHIAFIEQCCTFSQGSKAGQPFVMADWERAIVANGYGWKRPDGMRRYRVILVIIARGNGKSEFGAALVCKSLFLEDDPPEPGGHIFSAAGKRSQTQYVFDPVCTMIRNCSEMNSRAEIFGGQTKSGARSVVVGKRAYYPMSRETHTGTEHGGAPHFAVADEVHAHLDRRLITAIETGMIKRSQPLLFAISTPDFDRPDSPCNEMHEYARKVRDNEVTDPTFLPVLFENDKDADYTDPEVWRAANPMMGITLQQQDLSALCEKAKSNLAFRNDFKRLHCCIQTDAGESVIPVEQWDACQGDLPSDLPGRSCWCGLDLGATQDLTAFAAAYPLDDGRLACEFLIWVPRQQVVDRAQRSQHAYANWVEQGFLIETPGASVDYSRVRADINAFAAGHNMQELAVDKMFQGAGLLADLEEQDGLPAFEHRQGMISMAMPSQAFHKHVVDRTLLHDGNPVIRWMIGNLIARFDHFENWMPDKKRSGDKIDGVVALIMAVGRAMGGETAGDFYNSNEVRTV